MEGGLSYFERCKQDPNLPIFLTGIIQSGDKPNRNGRIYPWDFLKRECLRYMENEVRQKRAFGELDHPEDSSVPSLSRASHIIEDIWFEGTDVWARIKILNAYASGDDVALKARALILNGANIGISSRALGSLEEATMNGYDVVAEDLELICWDLVSNASNYGSEKMDFTENKGRRPATLIKESQCVGPHCTVGKTQRLSVEQIKFQELTENEKTYLSILGVEKFLMIQKQVLK